MVDNIPTRIRHWEGKTNHICCFNHIINLVTKRLLKLFEVPKGKRDPSGKTELDEAEAELERLGKDLEVEDLKTQVEDFHNMLTAEGSDDDEDVIDVTNLLDADELADFRENIVPIRLALTKVCVVCSVGKLVLIFINCSCSTLSHHCAHTITLFHPLHSSLLAAVCHPHLCRFASYRTRSSIPLPFYSHNGKPS
jgi:hypothetical protein